MPFDLIGQPLDPPSPNAEPLLGVPRHLAVERAMAEVAPTLRSLVAELRLGPGGRFPHMGMVFDTIAWEVVWRRPGLPEMRGTIPVWNGAPV